MNYLKFFFIVLSFFTFVKAEQTTILEPKVIEYKGVKEGRIKQVEEKVENLTQKQKSLEEKISKLEKIKNTSSQQNNELLERLLTDMEELKNNQKLLAKSLQEIKDSNSKIFFTQLITILIFLFFIFFIFLAFRKKKTDETLPSEENQSDSDIIKALTEKAKEDPKVAEVLKAYLNSRRLNDEV
ncbi:MAG: viral A-type inclusion protein [Sulfurihydrogenibium sp.]